MDELLLITENTGRITEYHSDVVRPGCLGKLIGPLADLKESTRNERFYSTRLWENVFATPWVKEAYETNTLFGEADHPDRLDTKLKEAAVVLTKYKFDEEAGLLQGEFDILDTPNGRILKSLADYGCKLGVSSRGRGKLIESKGKKVVDEKSYLFGGFDVVVLPAVKKARQSFINEDFVPTDLTSVSSKIESQINESSSASDLNVIKNILKSTGMEDFNELLNKVDNKVTELSTTDNPIVVEGLTNDLKEAYETIAKLTAQINDSSTDTISEDNMVDLKFMHSLVEELSDANSLVNSLRAELSVRDRELIVSRESIESYKSVLDTTRISNSKLANESKVVDTQKLVDITEELSTANSKYDNLKVQLDETLSVNKSLTEQVDTLTAKLESTRLRNSGLLTKIANLETDFDSIQVENTQLVTGSAELIESYLNIRCIQTGLQPEIISRLLPSAPSMADIEGVIKENSSLKRRVTKLPFITGATLIAEGTAKNTNNNNESLNPARSLLESMKTK